MFLENRLTGMRVQSSRNWSRSPALRQGTAQVAESSPREDGGAGGSAHHLHLAGWTPPPKESPPQLTRV